MEILRACVLAMTMTLLPRLAVAGCAPIASASPAIIPATAVPDTLTVTFLGHSSFLIETPDGVRVVTDYNGYNVPGDPPDIVTMNHAHSSHYTDFPDSRIKYVLRGWRDDGKPAEIDMIWRDLHVVNQPTNIRAWRESTEFYGNSVFLFESAGLCIAHLGHLHHLLTEQDLVLLGHVDVVMAPVDGAYTLSHEDMAAVLEQMHPRLVLPMHYFMRDVLARFLDLVHNRYAIRQSATPTLYLSRDTLPGVPTVIVLPGGF